MSATDVTEEVVNDALFKDKPETTVVAWLGVGRWVVIDTEDQSVCLVTVQEAVIIPKIPPTAPPWAQPLVPRSVTDT